MGVRYDNGFLPNKSYLVRAVSLAVRIRRVVSEGILWDGSDSQIYSLTLGLDRVAA